MTEGWAARARDSAADSVHDPVEQYGLDPNGEAVLQNAVANGAT